MSDALKPGDPRRLGRFKMVGRLGAGGMGVAYLGRSDSGDPVVVKTVRLDFADDQDLRRRFRREVLTLSAVESQFVPRVLASDLTAERQWVALEYFEGPTLAERVRTDGPLGSEQQFALAVGVAQGLVELHDHGLIHRDVKPSNVICTPSGPRLVDFGVARFENLADVTKTGALPPGSPGWMAPEQLDPQAVATTAIDVFAWGCLCWFTATGVSPFAGGTAEQMLDKLRRWSNDAALPDTLAPELHTAVRSALAVVPGERAVMRSQLEGIASGATDVGTLVATAWQRTEIERTSVLAAASGSTLRVATSAGLPRKRRTMLLGSAVLSSLLALALWLVVGGFHLGGRDPSIDHRVAAAESTRAQSTSVAPSAAQGPSRGTVTDGQRGSGLDALSGIPRFQGRVAAVGPARDDRLLPFLRKHIGRVVRIDAEIASSRPQAPSQLTGTSWSHQDPRDASFVWGGAEVGVTPAADGDTYLDHAHGEDNFNGYFLVESITDQNQDFKAIQLTAMTTHEVLALVSEEKGTASASNSDHPASATPARAFATVDWANIKGLFTQSVDADATFFDLKNGNARAAGGDMYLSPEPVAYVELDGTPTAILPIQRIPAQSGPFTWYYLVQMSDGVPQVKGILDVTEEVTDVHWETAPSTSRTDPARSDLLVMGQWHGRSMCGELHYLKNFRTPRGGYPWYVTAQPGDACAGFDQTMNPSTE